MNIYPLKGTVIQLGMEREAVYEKVGKPDDTFWKHTDAVNTSDEYKSLGIFVYYDENDTVMALEFWNAQDLYLGEINVFQTPYERLIAYVQKLDAHITADSDTLKAHHLQIIFWYENDIKPTSICNSVTLYTAPYHQ